MSNEQARVNTFRATALSLLPVAFLIFILSASSSAHITGAHQAEKDAPGKHLIKAREAYEAKKYSLAKDELNRALSLDKDIPQAHLLLGMTYRVEGNRRKAIEYVNNAIKHNPNYPDAHYILALLMFETNDKDKALQEIDLSIAQGARFSNAFYLKGQIYLAHRNTKEALKSFEEALRLSSPKDEMLPKLREQTNALRGLIEFYASKRDASYEPPKLLNNPSPSYSVEARQEGVQGTVRVAVLVNEEGKVASTIIFLGIGYGLDEQAAKAASKLKFKPAIKDGKPVSFWQYVEVEFKLRPY